MHDLCSKIVYDKKGAKSELNRLNNIRHSHKQKNILNRKENRIYYCEECNGWHLTSMDEEEYQEAIKWRPVTDREEPTFKGKWNYLMNCISPYKK